jgi:serine/threonine protein kinase
LVLKTSLIPKVLLIRYYKPRYKIKESEAKSISEFLLPMLNPIPKYRITAHELLKSEWLTALEPVV